MDGNLIMESRLGEALPMAANALPRWHEELLRESLDVPSASSTGVAGRKRQRFGLVPGKPSRIYASDRFIPSRRSMDMDYCSVLIDHEVGSDWTSSIDSNGASTFHSGRAPTSSQEQTNQVENLQCYRETLATNLLLQSPSKSKKTLLNFHDRENTASNGQYASPTSVASHPTLKYGDFHGSNTRSRHISTSPTRILDAPDLRDDYYLNLVSWGENNVLAVALDRVVYLYNTDTGAIQEIKACTARRDYVTSVAWIRSATTSCDVTSSNPNKLAIGTYRSELQVWDTITATKEQSFSGHSDRIGALAWNGMSLSSGSRDAKILHHDIRVGTSGVMTLQGHQQEICGLAWSPDGKTLASGGNDNHLCLWDAKMFSTAQVAPRERLLHHRAAVKALAWCPWKRHLLASGGGTADRTIKFWNAGSGRMLNSVHTGSQVCGLVWSKTERELLSSHGFSQNELCLWKYPTMARLRELKGHTARVLYLAVSPDGSSVVSAAADETLRFWNVFSPSKKSRQSRLQLTTPLRSSSTLFSDMVIR